MSRPYMSYNLKPTMAPTVNGTVTYQYLKYIINRAAIPAASPPAAPPSGEPLLPYTLVPLISGSLALVDGPIS